MIYPANVAKLGTAHKCHRSQWSALLLRCPWPARVPLGAAMTLMMGPAALAQGTDGPSLLLLTDCYSLAFPMCAFGSTGGGCFHKCPVIPPLSPDPGGCPQEKRRRRRGWTRCSPENIEPFTPIYCCNTNTDFIFSLLYPVAQHCWKITVALLDTQTAIINGL